VADKTNQTSQDQWEAIIIGSGMGGLSASAALAKNGHKVLILEQYQTLGGQTHSFSREGFSWDVGIHYLSGFAPGEFERELLDWLCDSQIELESMGSVYDVLHMGDNEPLQLSRPFEAQIRDLKDRFPDEGDVIDTWFEAIRDARQIMQTAVSWRGMPQPVGAFMEWWKRGELKKWCARTTAEVAADITDNPDLAAAFFAQWPDHGGQPSKASFAMHALIAYHYLKCGAWYPVGGASAIADNILPVIKNAGGEARTNVRVDKLIFDDDRVVGVKTADGDDIYAKHVISNIGARETVDKLLPVKRGQNRKHDDWIDEIRSFAPSICHFSVYLGFEGDVESAGATKANHWIYPKSEVDTLWMDAPDSSPPGMFVSFASLKDPKHDPGTAKKHAGEILVWTDWSVIKQWVDLPPGERGEDYSVFKVAVKQQILDVFNSYFPDLAQLLVFSEISTPLSTETITGHRQGAFYGLDVTPDRILSESLHAKTPIKGLHLSGQDVATPGIPGAMLGGVFSAGTIDPRVFKHL